MTSIGTKSATKSTVSVCNDIFKLVLSDLANDSEGLSRNEISKKKSQFLHEVEAYHNIHKGQKKSFGLLSLIKSCLSEWSMEAKEMKQMLVTEDSLMEPVQKTRVMDILDLFILCIPFLKKQSLQTIREFTLNRGWDIDVDVYENIPYFFTTTSDYISLTGFLKHHIT